MTMCIKRMITYIRKINVLRVPSTKAIDERKKRMEMAKCAKRMITYTRKINILIQPNIKKINNPKEKRMKMT